MTSTPSPPAPGLDLLTGTRAAELLDATLAAAGGEVVRWRVAQVDHRPAQGTTVSYAVRVRWADGSVTRETIGACSGRLPGGVVGVSDGATEAGLWRFPFDPDLPGLRRACDPAQLRQLLRQVGLADGKVRLRVRAYRPRRRAVIEVSTPGGAVFVKVVRPEQALPLHERHRLVTGAGCPAPESLGWSDDGIVVLAALPGRSLRARLLDGGTDIRPDDVPAVLDALPTTFPQDARRRTWGQKAGHYAEVLAQAAPAHARTRGRSPGLSSIRSRRGRTSLFTATSTRASCSSRTDG